MKAFLQEAKISKNKWISSLIQQKTAAEWLEKVKKNGRFLAGFSRS